MIFGRAVNFKIESTYVGSSGGRLYGNFRFHIVDRSIGNPNDIIELTSSARWAQIFLQAAPRRVRQDLDNATTIEVFDALYQRYVCGISQTQSGNMEVVSDHQLETWDRDPYLLDDVGQSSTRDKYTILVIGTGCGDDRIIVKSYAEETLNEVIASNGDIDGALREYCAWVDELGRQER